MNSAEKNALLTEKVKSLYQRSLVAIPLNYLTSAIVVFVLYGVTNRGELLVWLTSVFILTTIRTLHVAWAVNNKIDWPKYAGLYQNIYFLFALLAGLLWTAMFLYFGFKVPEEYLLFIIFTMGGMAIGAASSMASSPLCYFAYMFPLVLPPGIALLFQAGKFGYAMSFLVFLLFGVLLTTYMQSYRVYLQSLFLKAEKDNLIKNLKVSNKELEEAYEKIMNLSNTDELTHIYNRRFLDSTLKREWGRAQRSDLPLGFIMLDIDFFKDYNDAFGHQEGDKCLEKIGSALEKAIRRPGDMAARYGGEEFCLVLPDTTIEGALLLAENIKKDVEDLKIKAGNKSVSPYVTISLGVSSVKPGGKLVPEDLIYAADKALYLAKQHGRNRIETWETDV